MDASSEQIKQAYKKMAKRYHPDRPTGNKDAFQRLQKAQEVMLQKDEMPHFMFEGMSGMPGMPGNMFDHIFRAHRQATSARTTVFTQTTQTFPLRSILQGQQKYKKYEIPTWIRDGDIVRVSQNERVVVRLQWPAGVSQHRSGRNNILLKKQISLDKALLGRDIRILHPDGRPLRLKGSDRVYQSKREYRIVGEGLPDRNGHRGDMFVSFDIHLPERLTETHRVIFAKLFPEERC